MKTIFIVAVLLCLEGCASRQPVHCDWRLKPINAPAPKAKTIGANSKHPPIQPSAGEEQP